MDRYAVFGNPVDHSLSPMIHSLFAAQTGQQMEYLKIAPPLDDFASTIRGFFVEGGLGANVTLPFKEQAFTLIDGLSERAWIAGAVNLLARESDGSLYGDNSDGAGLVHDLADHYGSLEGMRILLIGAGGAARGVIGPLLGEKPATLVITNRTHSKAEQLAAQFSPLSAVASDQLNGQFDLIINSTSASIQGDIPLIKPTVLRHDSICYDMMYAHQDTPFIVWARDHGVRETLDGLGMLVWQAAESFLLWRGILPDARGVLKQLRETMPSQSCGGAD